MMLEVCNARALCCAVAALRHRLQVAAAGCSGGLICPQGGSEAHLRSWRGAAGSGGARSGPATPSAGGLPAPAAGLLLGLASCTQLQRWPMRKQSEGKRPRFQSVQKHESLQDPDETCAGVCTGTTRTPGWRASCTAPCEVPQPDMPIVTARCRMLKFVIMPRKTLT